MSTLKTLVDFKTIQSSHLYNKKPSTQALYGYPFIFLYTFVIVLGYLDFEAYFKYNEYYYVILGIIFTLNLLTWLSCFWNLNIKGIVKFSKAYDPYKAEYIKIIPKAHNGNGDFCELIKTKLNSDDKLPEVSFVFQKQKFIYNTDKKKFEALSYPCDFGGILEEFQNHKGLDEAQVEKLTSKYSLNNFDIPVPSFQELFKEHAVAPFFVFQIFCVGLWCLDEFWYYSLFTLFMLVAFESTVVYQRVRTLTEFRSLSLKPFDIYVLRSNEWKLVKSDLLVPGDIISVVRSGEESAVPCDVLILSGNCIVNEAMLSGESTPLLKESIRLREGQDELDLNGVDKNHTLHGGTKVLQVTNTEACPFNAPDAGSIGYVLKTGFGTSQGELVRTMVYSTERVSANNLEALLFILFLLIFAIAAAAYVWIEGTKNNLKTRYKLVLDCILIITSVVPPELPMELSLAVNNSLVALAKEYIYCTEPFRIPFAGKVDICCFDKTGTLTSENLVVEGIAGVSKKDLKELIDPKEAPKSTENVLAAAHALAFIEENGIVGDPMEKATLEAISWRFQDDVVHSSNGQDAIKIFRRFQFSSALKRMSTISKIANTPRDQYLIAVKGAPETIQTMLTTVPQGYEEAYKYFSRRGNRVISLAYKNISLSNISMVEKLPREEAESGLIFAGFLIFHNPLKEDSKESIKMLNESNHRVIMITGDNALTACHVAQEVEITDQQVLIIDAKPDVDNVLTLKSVDETVSVEVDTTNINKIDQSLINKYDFCMTGPAIKILENTELFKQLLNYTWVYARVSPSQKEYILSELKHEGLTTLMCGDGTNDVGALKQAHVGIALLDATVEDLEKIAYKARIERLTKLYEQQKQMAERFNMPTPPPPPMLAQALGLPANQTAARTVNGRPAPQVDALSMSTQLLEELDDEVPTIKFGDASVASPFTSKLATIKSVCSIIRLGRCTLVATIQMYKILALNCLISAYSLSVLYLDGIKYGDYQATLTGFLLAICFMCISKAKPLDTLAKERPQTNIFNPYLIGSVLGQFAIHIVSLIYIVSQAKSIEVQKPVDLEGEYEPTILNSAVFIISLTLQVSTFAVNYQGRPWRESMRENTALFYGLTGCAAVAFACAIELVPELNSFFQLAPLPGDFQLKLIGGLIFDFGMAYLVEMGFKKMFGNNQPHPITQRRKKLAN